MRKDPTKGFALVEALIVVVVLVVLGVAGYFVYQHSQDSSKKVSDTNTSSSNSNTTQTSKDTTVDPYAGWKTEALAGTQLTFKHPGSWTVGSVEECDGAQLYNVNAPTSELQQSGLTDATLYGLTIIVNAELSGTSACAPSAVSRAGRMLGSQSHSQQIGNGALKGKYIIVDGGSDGTSGIDVLGDTYAPGQKITETGIISTGGVNLQVASSFAAGQSAASVNISSFLSSELYKETVDIVNSLASNGS